MPGWSPNRSVRSGLVLVVVFCAAAFGFDPATSQAASSPGHSPVPVFSAAYGVSCPRASYCLAVGAYNANDVVGVLTNLWDGSTWSVIPSAGPTGAASSVLNAISCASASHCVAVGSYTDSSPMTWPLAESWNGSAWTIVSTPTPNGATFAGLSGISCTGASHCVAVGSYTNSRSVSVTLTEVWNGSAWSIVHSPNPRGAFSSTLSAVSCVSASACMATGSATGAATGDRTLAERWDGSSWSIVPSPTPDGAQGSFLNGVACPTPSRCLAVGSYFDSDFVSVTLAESWDGSSWSIVPSSTPTGSPSTALSDVSCAGASRCLAVGDSEAGSFAAKDDTLAESWNGSSWSIVASPSPSTTSYLDAVSCARATKCLAVGSFFNSSGDYQTLAESWGGSSLSIANQDADLAGVSCVDVAHCMAVGSYLSRGSVSVTLAERWSGRAWQTVRTANPSDSQGSYLNAITCLSVDGCVAVGYYYSLDNSRRTLIETWNGKNWSIVPSPNPSGAAYSVLYGVFCSSASQCMAVGSSGGLSLAEEWNGSTWSIVPTSDPGATAYSELTGVFCSSATHCLAVGYETDTHYHADVTLAEEWDGSAWTIVPSAAPGEDFFRSSVLHGMSCSTAGGCLAVGYHERKSGTFATITERWTGQRWVVVGSPSPTGSIYSELSAISCVDTGTCVAVGNYFKPSGDFVPLSENWTGTQWSIVASPDPAAPPPEISYLHAVSCAASSSCLASGTFGNPAALHPLGQLWNGSSWRTLATRRE